MLYSYQAVIGKAGVQHAAARDDSGIRHIRVGAKALRNSR